MAKKIFVVISINRGLFDYNTLLEYLKKNILVSSLYIIPQGFFVEILYGQKKEYGAFISYVKNFGVSDIQQHPVLHESFLSRYFNVKDLAGDGTDDNT